MIKSTITTKLLNSEDSNPNIFEKQITIKEIMEQISDSNGLASPGPPSEGVNSPGIPPILLKIVVVYSGYRQLIRFNLRVAHPCTSNFGP